MTDSLKPDVDRFRGCLLAGAIGDALGYPIEFMKSDEIVRRFGASAPSELNFDGRDVARISDDTQMTLFTGEGLIRAKERWEGKGSCHPPTIMAFALLRWYETQGGRVPRSISERGWLVEEKRLHAQRAPGRTCMAALASLASSESVGASIPNIEAPPNNSKGCGAVMRVAPCGLGASTRELAFEFARDNGVITHGHPSGYLSAAYLAAIVWDLARGATLPIAMRAADELLATERGHEETKNILGRARDLADKGRPDVKTIEA